ncbi:FkbM family methyltransferase [bacterium]|nr:FkbM family methyltransferase [bacterium]
MNKFEFSVSELLFDCFMSRRKVYCYGATHEAVLFIERYPGFFNGVIDRAHSAQSVWAGIECRDIKDIDDQAIVINCITAGHAWSVDQDLKKRTPFVLHIFELFMLLSDNHQFNIDGLSPVIREWAGFPSIFLENIRFYEEFSSVFRDKASVEIYRDYLDARICGDILLMGQDKTFVDPATMYFQDFLPQLDDYMFLDVGAFDGLNSLAFIKQNQDAKVMCFDPNPDNVKNVECNLAEHRDRAIIIQALLGAENGMFSIEPSGSSTAKIHNITKSSVRVEQTTLDNIYIEHQLGTEKVFLKMDVEGSESDILRGASEFLKGKENILALSCYHKSKDLETLWPLVKPFSKGRNVLLRHFTTGACETVLFIC